MYCCNELISLSVLSLYEGELIGIVDKLYFDKKLKKLISIELIGNNDTRYILPAKNIYHVGQNAITIKNNQSVSLKVDDMDLITCPVGSKAYSIKGEYLGMVKELTMNEKYLTEKLSLDNGNIIPISTLASIGKNTIIFSDNSEKIDIKKFKSKPSPKTFKTDEVQAVSIQPVDIAPVIKQPSPTPIINSQNSDFLLGRICTKDIYNFNNELLIKNLAKITKKNLKEVSRYGKIRELMLYSKEN